MYKYWTLAKTEWNSMFAYRFDLLSSAVLSFMKIALALVLWGAIYESKEKTGVETIGGFTFGMMITYYIISTLFSRIDQSSYVSNQFTEEIRMGTFTKYLVKPISPFLSFLTISYARTLYVTGINVIATIVWILILRRYIEIEIYWPHLFHAVSLLLLGLVLMSMIHYLLSVLSLWFIDVSSFFVLKTIVLEFLVGGIIPLHLFPDAVVQIFKLLPFYYIFYLPTVILIDNNAEEWGRGIVVLLLWSGLLITVTRLLYSKGLKKYEGVGG